MLELHFDRERVRSDRGATVTKQVYVREGDPAVDNPLIGWIDVTELLAAMGVEVCATTVSELSAENENLKADLENSERRMHGFELMWRSTQNERNSAMQERDELRKVLFDAQQMYGAQVVINNRQAATIGDLQQRNDELATGLAKRDALIAMQAKTADMLIAERDAARAQLAAWGDRFGELEGENARLTEGLISIRDCAGAMVQS